MDNFIYSIPNYKFDWSKYIYPIPTTINPQTELFNFLNITVPPLSVAEDATGWPSSSSSPKINTLHLNKPKNPVANNNNNSSKFSKTVRSKHFD